LHSTFSQTTFAARQNNSQNCDILGSHGGKNKVICIIKPFTSDILKMEAISMAETSLAICKTTGNHNPTVKITQVQRVREKISGHFVFMEIVGDDNF
jgi:hypothetical protein